MPLPLSNFFILVICATDIWSAISLTFEEGEFDIMTRKPRSKDEHLLS